MTIDGVVAAGIDIGSTSAQSVIVCNNDIISYVSKNVGTDRRATAENIYAEALSAVGIGQDRIQYVVGTGYGRYQVPFADKNVTEITCHSRGAHYFFPNAHTVLDIGGQDSKAISCSDTGKVTAFVMNDKCAAGTGRSIDVISRLLKIPLEEIGPLSLDIDDEPPAIGSTCVLFARSEALNMIRSGISRNLVLAAYCDALVQRLISLMQRIGIEQDIVLSGGVARNIGVVKRIEKYLGVSVYIGENPQINGAVGAALIARDLIEKIA